MAAQHWLASSEASRQARQVQCSVCSHALSAAQLLGLQSGSGASASPVLALAQVWVQAQALVLEPGAELDRALLPAHRPSSQAAVLLFCLLQMLRV